MILEEVIFDLLVIYIMMEMSSNQRLHFTRINNNSKVIVWKTIKDNYYNLTSIK